MEDWGSPGQPIFVEVVLKPYDLGRAAAEERLDIMAKLLEAGADPDSTVEWQNLSVERRSTTALMYAAKMGNFPMVELLLTHGCDVNKEDSSRNYVLDWARKEPRDLALWQRLLEAGADIHHRNGWGGTPLVHHAPELSPEIVQLLISAGADVAAVDPHRRTALIKAVQRFKDDNVGTASAQTFEVVRALLNAGVDVTAKDSHGNDAEEYAWQNCRHGTSRKIYDCLCAEIDRRKAAVLSVLPGTISEQARRLVLEKALLLKDTSERKAELAWKPGQPLAPVKLKIVPTPPCY